MKNGYMFFLNIGALTYIARIMLIVCTVALFWANLFFWRAVILVCLVVCLLISIIKAPSDKDVMRQIERFRAGFRERIADHGHAYSMQGVKMLEAYKIKGQMRLRRTIGYDVIYPNLVSVAIARAEGDSLELYIDELCLLKSGEENFTRHIVDSSSFCIASRVDPDDSEVLDITIRCERYPEGLKLIAKNDFHYKEFTELAESVLKI